MTIDEKKSILEGAIDRAYAAISEVHDDDLWTDRFYRLISNTRNMEWWLFDMCGGDMPVCNEGDHEATSAPDKQPAPEKHDTPAPEEPSLTKEAVKARLLELSGKYDALDVASLMEGMGYIKLSDVPADRYQELLNKAEAAVKEMA